MTLVETALQLGHGWQAFPNGDGSHGFRCGPCGVYIATAEVAQHIPDRCPELQPAGYRAHLLYVNAKGALACLSCLAPPAGEWDWTCGGSDEFPRCDYCAQRRRSATYRGYHMAVLCDQCTKAR